MNLVRHQVAHLYAMQKFSAGWRVLDLGCGTGHGTAMVAKRVAKVVGIDPSAEAVAYARDNHAAENITFRVMDATDLKLRDEFFHAVYSIQVIEHVEEVERYLAEASRVLRPGGVFVVATPNRLTYSPNGIHNRFHVKEYDARELGTLLATVFGEVEVVGLHAGLDLALHPGRKTTNSRSVRRRFDSILEGVPPELRATIEDWLVEDGFDGFDFEALGPHSFPVSAKSVDTSLDLLATCRKS